MFDKKINFYSGGSAMGYTSLRFFLIDVDKAWLLLENTGIDNEHTSYGRRKNRSVFFNPNSIFEGVQQGCQMLPEIFAPTISYCISYIQ